MADKFAIFSKLNGLALTVEFASKDDGAKLITFPFTGGENQQFRFKYNGEIESVNSGKVLTVEDGSAAGHKIIQSHPRGDANQLWRKYFDGTIRNVGYDLCLDVSEGNTAKNTPIIAYQTTGGDNQKWLLVNDKF